jgi:integrase
MRVQPLVARIHVHEGFNRLPKSLVQAAGNPCIRSLHLKPASSSTMVERPDSCSWVARTLHISTRQVQRLLDQIATRAVLQDERPVLQRSRKRISLHPLRHSAASWWLDAGIRIGDVARQLVHGSLSTTTRYVDRAPNHSRESFRRAGVDKML